MLPATAFQHLYTFSRPATEQTGGQTTGEWGAELPETETSRAGQGQIDLKRAMRDWAEVYYAPLDVAALDAPEVCDRCRQHISPDDALDYLEAQDGSVAIVHEFCPSAV